MGIFSRKIKNRHKKKKIAKNYIYLKQNRRKKRLLFKVIYFTLFLILFSLAVYALFFTQYFKIKNVEFSGGDIVKEKSLNESYLKYISKKRLFFNQENIFALNKGGLEDFLIEKFNRIESAEIKRVFPDSLKISIVEFKPKGIICNKDDCFYFDKKGVIFEKAPLILGKSLLYIKDNDSDIKNLPLSIFDEKTVDFFSKLKLSLEKNSAVLVKYFLFMNDYGDIEIETENNFKIFITEKESSDVYSRAVSELLKNEIKEDLVNLDYIDLRIKGKAYYKLKEIEPVVNEDDVEKGEIVE